MSDHPAFEPEMNEDERLLRALGYRQELARRMSGFSNFAISFSIICILAGGITSFHVALCSAGGASVALGWPLVCLFSLSVALTMAQIASAFPTAGGLYHWASILGGRGLGWLTAWFNLAGVVAVVAAVNAGAFDFANSVFGFASGPHAGIIKVLTVSAMTLSQGLLNHYGIRLTTLLTDLSGYLILVVTVVLTVGLLFATKHFEWARLWTFTNFSGLPPEAPVVPAQNNLTWLFALGFLLPAYTVTGFDASAHISEETLSAAHNVPRGIVRSVWVSGVFGWLLTATILLAIPELREGANKGADVVAWTVRSVLPSKLALLLLSCTVLAQYLCALAALTSASRMIFAFARDGGLPWSRYLGKVSSVTRAPTHAIWCTAVVAVFLTAVVPYTTIAAVCTVFLYMSYVLPVSAGFFSYGRTWTKMGPWELGAWYRPLAIFAAIGCGFLIVIGLQPPNQQAVPILAGSLVLLMMFWFGYERKNFKGPPQVVIAKAKEG